jgi:hypothetical protein
MDMGKTSRDFIVNAISSRAHFAASGSMTGRTGGGHAADHQLRGEALDEIYYSQTTTRHQNIARAALL